jgi:hypothetical protein
MSGRAVGSSAQPKSTRRPRRSPLRRTLWNTDCERGSSPAPFPRLIWGHLIDPIRKRGGFGAEARRIAETNARTAGEGASAIIDTGGGYQVIWRLKDKLPASSNQTRLENQNRGLAARFEADKVVTDMPRLLRLPGSVNWPDADKQKRGRVPRRASVQYRLAPEDASDKLKLDDLAQIAPPVAAQSKAQGGSRLS